MKRRRRTFSEWQRDVEQAYQDETCPSCGRPHGTIHVSQDGEVTIYCPASGATYWIASEPKPRRFSPEVFAQLDLPF
jgi:hypothetical protein